MRFVKMGKAASKYSDFVFAQGERDEICIVPNKCSKLM